MLIAVGVAGPGSAGWVSAIAPHPVPPRPADPSSLPGAEATALEAARRLIAAGSPKEAAELLERRLSVAPEDADALLLLGTARALLSERSRSLDALRGAVALRPDSAAAHHALCMALARFGEAGEARSSCEAAVAADPTLAEPHLTLGMILAAEEHMAEADEQFTKALEAESPARAQAVFLRGRLRRQQGRVGDAIRDLEEAVRLRSDSAPAFLELGRARIDLSDDAGAIEALRRAAELDPDSFDARSLLGLQYLRVGDAASAVPHLRAAVADRPDDRDVVYGLGRALRATGETDEAREVLRGLSRQSQGRAIDDASIREAGRLNNEGISLERQGDYEGASARYRAAVEISPDNPLFHKNLGLVLCRQGRWKEAKAELREVLRLTPGEPDALRALYIALDHEPDPDPAGPR